MLSAKKQEIRAFIKRKVNPKNIKIVSTKRINFFTIDYNFNKHIVPVSIIAGLVVFLLSLWFYLLPENTDYISVVPSTVHALKPTKKPQNIQPKKKQKEHNPIVKVSPAKVKPVTKSSLAINAYNQAVQNDRQGNWAKAMQLYKQALKSKHPKIQENAMAIQRRLDFLSHQR